MGDSATIVVDHNHPLHLPTLDAPGVVLISMKLTGPENYALWSRSMRIAVLVKFKLGFVDGTCFRSSFKVDLVPLPCCDCEKSSRTPRTTMFTSVSYGVE